MDLAVAAQAEDGEPMKTKAFFDRLDQDQMVAAIAEAEKQTSGEIRVFVSHRKARDAQDAAVREFVRLGMTKTKRRNAVLIYVAPVSQNFAVIGDEAVHAKCGEEFWCQVAAQMTGRFRAGEFTAGIVDAIQTAGALLARHFPRDPHDRNELPDTIAGL